MAPKLWPPHPDCTTPPLPLERNAMEPREPKVMVPLGTVNTPGEGCSGMEVNVTLSMGAGTLVTVTPSRVVVKACWPGATPWFTPSVSVTLNS